MPKDELKKYLHLFIAVGIALAVAIYYFASGNSSLNNNIRELEKSSTIEKVQTTDSNTVVVKCKNGESYEIVYQPGQTNYQDLVYNKCGEAGELNVTTQQAQ
jgi:hypothetical protein